MIKFYLPFLLLLNICFYWTITHSDAQTLPPHRSVDWTIAGLRDTSTMDFIEIDMQSRGVIGDGSLPNDSILSNTINAVSAPGAILIFPEGNFLFNQTIVLPSNTIIRGKGASKTIFTLDLGRTGYGIMVNGSALHSDTSSFTQSATKDSSFILVDNPAAFSVGDWIQIIQNDSNLVTSSWALKTVGQLVLISNIINNRIELNSPLRMDYNLARTPYIKRIRAVKNAGIECMKIHRIDDTAPEQMSNILFLYAVNCWVNGVESHNTTFCHIEGRFSSNLSVSKSYMHHAFGYGDGGRAYGVMLQYATNECRIEDNLFEHLRHSMIVQAGANGNVFAYNYSTDPFWSIAPTNSAGELVLHGNYPFANLFEQNICENIVIDNSHGPNGKYNTFFRNRAGSYGIFFSAANSPDQNIIGNEIPNTSFPYSLANYNIQGSGHFLHGNNNKGNIAPAGTSLLPDQSYAYSSRPIFVSASQWAGIGTPNAMGSRSIPARDRFVSNNIFGTACGDSIIELNVLTESLKGLVISPNPSSDFITISSITKIKSIVITNALGQMMNTYSVSGTTCTLSIQQYKAGLYFALIYFDDWNILAARFLKE